MIQTGARLGRLAWGCVVLSIVLAGCLQAPPDPSAPSLPSETPVELEPSDGVEEAPQVLIDGPAEESAVTVLTAAQAPVNAAPSGPAQTPGQAPGQGAVGSLVPLGTAGAATAAPVGTAPSNGSLFGLPERDRPRPEATNPVAFALATSHAVGDAVYARSERDLATAQSNNFCASYPSGMAAQEAFLGAGGPGSDRLGLDPDGDGYACQFDPTLFRNATNSGASSDG